MCILNMKNNIKEKHQIWKSFVQFFLKKEIKKEKEENYGQKIQNRKEIGKQKWKAFESNSNKKN